MHFNFSSRVTSIVIFFCCLFLSFALYGNTINAEFVHDDAFFVSRPELRDPAYLITLWKDPYLPQNIGNGAWRPITTLSFALNFILFGERPISFHIVNIILNGIATFTVFLFITKLTRHRMIGYFSALIFAFLPIHTGVVAFIKARDEILYTIFTLSSWIFFLKTCETKIGRQKHLFISSFLFLLAVLTKEQAVLAPFFFFGLEILRNGIRSLRSSFRSLSLSAIPYAATIILYLLCRFFILGAYAFGKDDIYHTSNPLSNEHFWIRIFTACKIAFIYIGKTFIPANLSATYTYNHLPLVSNPLLSWEAIIGIVFLGTGVTIMLVKKYKNTPLWYGVVIFLLCYLPISRFIFKDLGEIVEEHWMYLPSLGLSLILGHFLFRLYQIKKIAALISVAIILISYGIVTVKRNTVWHDEKSLYTSMIQSAPTSISGHLFLADWYYRNKAYALAHTEAQKAFSIYQDHPRVLNLLGKLELLSGQYTQAEQLFARSITIKPSLPESHKLYIRALSKQGRYEENVNKLTVYLAIAPHDLELRYLMALNLYKLGRLEEAVHYFDWRQDLNYEEKIQLLKNF